MFDFVTVVIIFLIYSISLERTNAIITVSSLVFLFLSPSYCCVLLLI